MNDQIRKLRREARQIAARYRQPEFYMRFKAPLAMSRKLFYGHPLVIMVRETVTPLFQEELGHGLYHSTRVSLECAALICIELETFPIDSEHLERLMVLGELAGILHDVCRDQEMHAVAGARMAAKLLSEFPVSVDEIQSICRAIENHEAFVKPLPCLKPSTQLISDCLYDADKFRWGPDTFVDTVWHMMNHQQLSPQDLLDRFPWGITGILNIEKTFRTATGRQFGPDFIEIGLQIGKEIYRYLLHHYGDNNHDYQ